MGLMCLLAVHLLQWQSSLCLHPESRLLLSCFYIASLWLRRFLWVGRRRVVFVLSFLCSWRSWQMILLPLGFCTYTFKNSTDCQNLSVVDLFLQKSFWFFPSMFSILGSMQLSCRALHILAAMDVRVIPR